MAACLMIIYIVILLEKCVSQMAKQPVKYIIVCCSFLLSENFKFVKSCCMISDLSESSVPYIIWGRRNSVIIDFSSHIRSWLIAPFLHFNMRVTFVKCFQSKLKDGI